MSDSLRIKGKLLFKLPILRSKNKITKLGLSGLMVICASCSAQVRKGEIFKTKTVPALMKMMTEADSLTLEEWTEELDDEALSKNDPASAAEETLAKIGYELTNKFMLPIFIPLIKECLS